MSTYVNQQNNSPQDSLPGDIILLIEEYCPTLLQKYWSTGMSPEN